MSEESILPRHLITLRDALQPLLRRLRDCEAPEAIRPMPIGAFHPASSVAYRLPLLESALQQLTAYINGPLARLVAAREASTTEVYRVAGGLESAVDPLLHGRADAHTLAHRHASGGDSLVEVYDHFLGELRDWLSAIDEVLRKPVAALRRRGLPTTGQVTLPLMLEFSTPPALHELRRAEREQGVGKGLPGILMLLGLGYLAGSWLFGRDDDSGD